MLRGNIHQNAIYIALCKDIHQINTFIGLEMIFKRVCILFM